MGGRVVRKDKKPLSVKEYNDYLLSIGFSPEDASRYTETYEKTKPEWEEDPSALETYGLPLLGTAAGSAAGVLGAKAAGSLLGGGAAAGTTAAATGGSAIGGGAALGSGGLAASTGVASIPTASGGAGVLTAGGQTLAANTAGIGGGGLAGTGTGIASALLPAAGIAAGGLMAYDTATGLGNIASGDDLSTRQQLAMALPSFGLSFAYNPLKKLFGSQDRWKTEQNRWGDLVKENPEWASIMPQDIVNNGLTGGRSKSQLQAIDEANITAGKWANPTFTASRSEADLKPEDTWGYSTWGEQHGPKYMTALGEEQRRALNQAAIGQGLVNEHHGTIDINHDALNAYIKANNPDIATALGLV